MRRIIHQVKLCRWGSTRRRSTPWKSAWRCPIASWRNTSTGSCRRSSRPARSCSSTSAAWRTANGVLNSSKRRRTPKSKASSTGDVSDNVCGPPYLYTIYIPQQSWHTYFRGRCHKMVNIWMKNIKRRDRLPCKMGDSSNLDVSKVRPWGHLRSFFFWTPNYYS